MADIVTLDEKVATNATVSQPNFTAAMTNLASTPSLMGQIGAEVASAATTKLMQEKGLELGKNPKGNLPILPINDYLKQLDSSYNSQAQATLSLRAQDTINKANEEMAKKPSLSTEDIVGYQQTLKTTLNDISELAPTGIREKLDNTFQSTLQNNTHQYVLKMDEQQRKKAAETQEAYINQETRDMQESATGGDLQKAKEHKDNAVAQLSQRLIDGNMSEPEKKAEEIKLNILMKQSEMIGEAIAAQEQHGDDGVEKYLATMQDKKPENMTYADYSVAMAGVYKAVNQREQYKASNRNMLISEAMANTLATGQPPNTQQQTELKRALTTQQFNETMLRINSALQHKAKNEDAATQLYNNHSSAEAWTLAGGQAQKKTFYRLTRDEISRSEQSGNKLSEVQAMTNVARTIPIPTNAYTDALRNKINTAPASEAMEAAVAYRMMSDGDPQDAARVSGLDDKAKVAASYMNFLSNSGDSNDEIASKSREIAYGNEEQDLITKKYGRFYNENLATKDKVNKFTKKIIDKSDLAIAVNSSLINDEVISANKKFFMLAKGNEDIATQLTKDYFKRYYGESNINGRPEYVVNPTERILGDVKASVPIIQEDIRGEISKQLKANNDAYLKGGSDIYYDVEVPKSKSGVPLTYENLYKLMDEANKTSSGEDAKKAVNDFDKFNSEFFAPRSIKVNVTRRYGDTEQMELAIYPSKSMQQSEDHSHVGGFDAALRTKNGVLISFESALANNISRVHYIANTQHIRDMAGSIPNLGYSEELFNKDRTQQNKWNTKLVSRGLF